jgi:putative membrane protein
MLFNPSIKRALMFTGAALLASVTAFAQMQQQPQPQPGAGTTPGGQPGSPGMQQPGGMPPDMNGNQASNPNQAMEDKIFVQHALEGGMAEVQLGQLAAQKASSPDVKQFGQQMVADHTKLGDAMSQVAQQVGVKPPTDLSKKDKQLKAKLEGLSGPQFDAAYIQAMVKDHKKDDSSFKIEAQQSQIPAVKQLAQQGEPIIASHLQMIQQIAQAHNLAGGKSTTSGMQ